MQDIMIQDINIYRYFKRNWRLSLFMHLFICIQNFFLDITKNQCCYYVEFKFSFNFLFVSKQFIITFKVFFCFHFKAYYSFSYTKCQVTQFIQYERYCQFCTEPVDGRIKYYSLVGIPKYLETVVFFLRNVIDLFTIFSQQHTNIICFYYPSLRALL